MQYLEILQRAYKWLRPQRDVTVGDIVLMKEEEVFQRHWPKGRIVATFPGKDGHVRTADVQTAKGLLKRRAIVRMVVLLPQEDDKSSYSPPEDVWASKSPQPSPEEEGEEQDPQSTQ